MAHLKAFWQRKNIIATKSLILAFPGTDGRNTYVANKAKINNEEITIWKNHKFDAPTCMHSNGEIEITENVFLQFDFV